MGTIMNHCGVQYPSAIYLSYLEFHGDCKKLPAEVNKGSFSTWRSMALQAHC